MEQPVVHLFGDVVAGRHRKAGINGDVHFRQHPMPQPADPDLGDLPDSIGDRGHVPDFVWHFRLDTVQQPREDRSGRLDNYTQYGGGYHQSNYRVSQGVSQPDSSGPKKDRQAGQAVDPGVVAVGDQRRAADLFPHLHSEQCHSFIAHEPDHGRQGYDPDVVDLRRVAQPPDGRVGGEDAGAQDG